jgi:hypothetical protein
MFGIENELYDQLIRLKEDCGLRAIKAEFEAEGSSYGDVARLRRISAKAGVALILKIGGVEALRDIKDSLELGVDGLVAPMVESRFGLKKFMDAYRSVYKDHRIHLAINIETRSSIAELEGIMGLATGFIDGVILGRTDLSASYLDPSIGPDCGFIAGLQREVGARARAYGLSFTVGGSISGKTVDAFRTDPSLVADVECVETRKTILTKEGMLGRSEALDEALRFEELYILSKKEMSDVMLEAELARIAQLNARASHGVSVGA